MIIVFALFGGDHAFVYKKDEYSKTYAIEKGR